MKYLYLQILKETGKVPDPSSPVFMLSTGKPLHRAKVSAIIKETLCKVGVPPRLAGSHSLRRGGASLYRAAGVPDEDVKRFGRWNSDAYKLYINITVTALDQWAGVLAHTLPRFELN